MNTVAEIPPAEGDGDMAYHRELGLLDEAVLRLGSMVCETIPWGTEVLLSGDLDRAQELINFDDGIDQLSVELEDQAYSLMASEAPMAEDLRHLVTVIKVIAELERSADLMVNVCKAARRMYGADLGAHIRGLVSDLGDESVRLVKLSMAAFADGDASLAGALSDMDDALDQLNRDMVEAIFAARSSDEIDMRASVQLALAARYYERIGDHAVNIGERVTYMVTGWLPEHMGALRQEERQRLSDFPGQ